MGIAYRGGSAPEEADNRMPLALVDLQPGEGLNAMLAQRLMDSQVVASTPMAEAPALEAHARSRRALRCGGSPC